MIVNSWAWQVSLLFCTLTIFLLDYREEGEEEEEEEEEEALSKPA